MRWERPGLPVPVGRQLPWSRLGEQQWETVPIVQSQRDLGVTGAAQAWPSLMSRNPNSLRGMLLININAPVNLSNSKV